MTTKPLTAKQKKAKPRANAGTSKAAYQARRALFVEAFIANGGNATEAAKSAGYSHRTAGSQGHDLLKVPEISVAIANRSRSLAKKYEMTTELVARSIVQELTFDPAKLYRDDGTLKAITELDEDVRMALTAVEFEQIGSPDAPVFVRKFKWAQKQGAREQAMKHLGMFEKDNQQRSPLDGLPRDVLKLIQERLLGRS